MKRTRLFLFAGTASLASACATPGVTAMPGGPTASVPVDAFVEVAGRGDGPQLNALGGEIPRSAPTAQVGEGGLSDAEPS
ncbi:MAG: hypothetical protein AAFS03_03310 [Pseudomonadota bacterium]